MDPIVVSFPGGKQVAAQVGKHLITTDQPEDLGGGDAAPSPFDLFLASLATCAGIYVLGFLQARDLSAEGLRITQQVEFDATSHLPTRIRLEVFVPAHVPAKYRSALVRAAEGCKVKKAMRTPPEFEVLGRFAVDAT